MESQDRPGIIGVAWLFINSDVYRFVRGRRIRINIYFKNTRGKKNSLKIFIYDIPTNLDYYIYNYGVEATRT